MSTSPSELVIRPSGDLHCGQRIQESESSRSPIRAGVGSGDAIDSRTAASISLHSQDIALGTYRRWSDDDLTASLLRIYRGCLAAGYGVELREQK